MKRVIAVDDVLTSGEAARELDRAFARFRAAVAEEHARQIAAGVLRELLRHEARERAATHAHEVRQILIEDLLEHRLDFRLIAAGGETPPAGGEARDLWTP